MILAAVSSFLTWMPFEYMCARFCHAPTLLLSQSTGELVKVKRRRLVTLLGGAHAVKA